MKKNCTWIRARSDEQKGQRISEIVSATEQLYQKYGYEEITFVQIAKEAGFTRSNLYKYFKSKEEIFLEFLKHDIKLWTKDLKTNYSKDGYCSINEFTEIWVDTLQKNSRLIELISILYLHLEKEASYDTLLDFKKSFHQKFQPIVERLSQQIKGFSTDKVAEFLNIQAALGIGLFQMTNLSVNQLKVLENPKFKHFKTDFRSTYTKSLKYIIEGLINHKD